MSSFYLQVSGQIRKRQNHPEPSLSLLGFPPACFQPSVSPKPSTSLVPPKTSTTSADPQRSSRCSIALNSHAVGPNPVAKMGSSRCSESRTRAPQGGHQRPSVYQVSDAPRDGKASLPGSAKSLKGKSPFRRLSLPSWSFPDEHVLFQQSQCWVAIGKADLGGAGVGPNTPDRNRSGRAAGSLLPKRQQSPPGLEGSAPVRTYGAQSR